jgi:hypothetical protein
MSILKKTTKEKVKDDHYIGIYIPKEMASYLSLYCLAIGVSKSSIVENLITKWVINTRKEKPTDKLLKDIAIKAFVLWENPNGKRTHFQTFKNQLKNELQYKKLDQFADEIINILLNEKNKKES